MTALLNKHIILNLTLALLGCVTLLWQLLLPGYILLLDWVPGSYALLPYTSINHFTHAPSNLFLYGLSFIFSAWVIQKILLIGVTFLLFFIPLLFFPWTEYRFARYFTAIFFAINPFVYERLLAGQWRVIVGYICLFPLVYFLLMFCRTGSWRSALGIFGTLLVTGMWSIHFLAIGLVITMLTLGIHFGIACYRNGFVSVRNRLKNVLLAFCLFAICSLYWIVPLSIYGSNQLETFDSGDYSAFTTVRDPQLGVVLNVLTLRGFWASGEAWGEQFKLPGNNPQMFYLGCLLLLGIMGIGWHSLRQDISKRQERFTLIVLFLLSTLFATGVSAYGLWQINYWSLENVPFWNGFRDAQKWAGVLALIYALLAGIGFSTLLQHFPRFKFSIAAFALLLAITLSPYQLFGLHNQVTPVWYPNEWTEVDTLLKKDPTCTAVFVPWHQYYSVTFNGGQLIANPAERAFECTVYTSQNSELGAITIASTKSEEETTIEQAVINNRTDSESIADSISQLRKANIKYIIETPDIVGRDIYLYPLLTSPELTLIYDSEVIKVYKIK